MLAGFIQAIKSVSMTEYAPRGSQDHNAFFPNSHCSMSQYSNDSGISYVYGNGQIPYSTVNGSYGSYPGSYLPSHQDSHAMYLSMPNAMQYTVLPAGRAPMPPPQPPPPPPRSLTYPYHAGSALPIHRHPHNRPRIGLSADLNLNPMADIEEQTSFNSVTMLSEPILPPLAGYPDVNGFDELVRDYVGGLSPKKQDKALIHARRAANILAVLVDKKTTAVESAQFRFWVKKMFTLLPNDPNIPDREKKICHEGKPVAVREKLFKILTKAHKACQHGGRDKTSAQVRRVYSWVPKELISRFVKLCPTCKVRRGQNRGCSTNMQTPDKDSPEDYDDGSDMCSPSNTSRRESEANKANAAAAAAAAAASTTTTSTILSPLQMQGSSSVFVHQNRWMTPTSIETARTGSAATSTSTSQPEDGKPPDGYDSESDYSYLTQASVTNATTLTHSPPNMACSSHSADALAGSDHSLTFASGSIRDGRKCSNNNSNKSCSRSAMYSSSGFPSSNLRSTNHWPQRGPPKYDVKQENHHYDTDMKY